MKKIYIKPIFDVIRLEDENLLVGPSKYQIKNGDGGDDLLPPIFIENGDGSQDNPVEDITG